MIYFQNIRVYHTSSIKTSCTVIQVYLIVKLQKSPVKTGERNIMDNNNILPHLTISQHKDWILNQCLHILIFFSSIYIPELVFYINMSVIISREISCFWFFMVTGQYPSIHPWSCCNVMTDREPSHMVRPSPEAQHEQIQRACGGIQCFKYGCQCKAWNSETWHTHIQPSKLKDRYSGTVNVW